MRKLFSVLACLCLAYLAQSQTTNTVNFTFTVDPAGMNATFTNTSVYQNNDPKKAFWYFGDSTTAQTIATAGITHHYSRVGTYQVCLRVYRYGNSGDSTLLGSQCKSVTIPQTCEGTFAAWDTTIAGTHLTSFYGGGYSNNLKPIAQLCWNFGDGSDTCLSASNGASPSQTILHHYAQAGKYNVCMRLKFDGGCLVEKCDTVVVVNNPVTDSCAANFTSSATAASIFGRRFVAQPWHSNGKKPVRICWTFGDGKDTCIQYTTTYAGDYVVEHQYANYGQYEVCVTIKYDGGCEKKKCNIISVSQPTPTVCSFDLAEAATAVANLERKFYVGLMQNAVAQKVCWNFGDGTDTCVVLSNPLNAQQLVIVHRYPAPSNYTVCAKVTYVGGCVAERCKPVSIAVAHSNICGGYMTDSTISANTVRFKGSGIQNSSDYVVSYNWTFGDGTTGSGQSVTHTFGTPGRYNVCLYLKTNTGCETRICNPIGVSGNGQPQLILTPNPVVNELHATFVSLFQQTVTVKIYNANGLMIRSYVRAANVGTNNWSFSDVGTLPTGVYSVIVQSANQFATAIFFKQ